MTMDLIKLACPSCGGSLQIPNDLDQVTCAYCQTLLVVQRGEGYAALKIAEKVEKAIRDSADETRTAIERGSEVTRDELRRMQLSQELSAARTRLISLQGEIRALERGERKGKAKRQLKALRKDERTLAQQVQHMERSLPAASTSGHPVPGRSPASVAAPKSTMSRALLYGCGTWLLAALLCGLPASALDKAIFGGGGEPSQSGLFFTLASLVALFIGLLVFLYVRNPAAPLWAKLRPGQRPTAKKIDTNHVSRGPKGQD
jgi:uncharacterized Zn finger protein (UPF0148 family)